MKKLINSIAILVIISFTACNQNTEPTNKKSLLTSHKWQLVKESGLNLPNESLNDNVIELKKDGIWVYYENKSAKNIFTANKWELSPDENKVIEILPDNKRVENEILELTENTLKVRYQEPDGLKGTTTVIETYTRLLN